MSAGPTVNDFDPATAAATLLGTWRYPRSEEPGGVAFFRFAETGRAYSFLFIPSSDSRPVWRVPLCPWYVVESPTRLRIHIKRDDEGAPHTYRLEGDTLSLTLMSICVERSWVLHRASADEIPEWFHERLAALLAKNP